MMTTADKWKTIQTALGIVSDGDPGDRTAGAVASLMGIKFEEVKPVIPTNDASIIFLPDEAVPGQVEAFYGKPSRNPDYLGWFNFPTADMRLYSRDGAQMDDHDGDTFDDHRCHRAVAATLQAAFAELWETLGSIRFFNEGWNVYGGCFNYRRKKAGNGHSIHSWGAAIDLTAWGTGLITDRCGFSMEGVEIMERHGFLWGPRAWGMPGEHANPRYEGKFFDCMHFQAAIPYLNKNSYYAKRGLPANIKRWQA